MCRSAAAQRYISLARHAEVLGDRAVGHCVGNRRGRAMTVVSATGARAREPACREVMYLWATLRIFSKHASNLGRPVRRNACSRMRRRSARSRHHEPIAQDSTTPCAGNASWDARCTPSLQSEPIRRTLRLCRSPGEPTAGRARFTAGGHCPAGPATLAGGWTTMCVARARCPATVNGGSVHRTGDPLPRMYHA